MNQDAGKIQISLCMITGDEAESLNHLLESAAPHVDELCLVLTGDKRKTRDTTKVARRWVEQAGGQIKRFRWVHDFSAARQVSFEMASHDWRLWLDSDDELVGGENLKPLLARLDPGRQPVPQVGLALPYYYGFDDMGNPVTIITRTRCVYWPFGWQWQGRVHEDIRPSGYCEVVKSPDVKVLHFPVQTHETSAERNLKILLMQYEDDPADRRTMAYLGHQYTALNQWDLAAEWYERFLRTRPPENMDVWQIWHFLATAYRNLDRLADASAAEFRCIQIAPQFADPYYGLAAIALKAGDPAEAIHWTGLGRQGEEATEAPFYNPLEYDYNPTLVANVAFAALGRFRDAVAEVDRGLQIRPDDAFLTQRRQELLDEWGENRKARAFVSLAQGAEPFDVLAAGALVGQEVISRYPASRRVYQQALHDRWTYPNSGEPGQIRVIIYCGQGVEEFGPRAVATGRGGSETAAVRVGQELAKLGARVDIYNSPGQETGLAQTNLFFWPYELYNSDDHDGADLFVAWRQPGYLRAAPAGVPRWLWMHDLHRHNQLTPELADLADLIRPVSEWAGEYLLRCYPFLEPTKVLATRNATDLQNNAPGGGYSQERGRRLLWASSPDRGLLFLLKIWRFVREVVDDARLTICYGWEVFDKAMKATRDPAMMALKQDIARLSQQPGVEWRGRLSKADLATTWQECGVWCYTTEFLEVSCITAMDAMASGAAILTSRLGALPETLGEVGLQIHGGAAGPSYQKRMIGHLVNVLQDPGAWQMMAEGGPERAAGLTWAGVAEEWLQRIGERISG